MGTRQEKRMVKKALVNRAKKDLGMVKEIKGFPFRLRLAIAWAIIKGNK